MSETQPVAPGGHGAYEPCGECGAPLDPQQRYCVHCAARRGNGANPSSRYFAAMSKRARRPISTPAAKPPQASRAAAVAAAPAQTATNASPAAKKAKSKAAKADKGRGKVIAKTSNGEVHQVTGLEVSKEKEEEDTHLVEGNVKQSGSTYIKAQQNLPDVIVVGGEPGSTPAPTGSQP